MCQTTRKRTNKSSNLSFRQTRRQSGQKNRSKRRKVSGHRLLIRCKILEKKELFKIEKYTKVPPKISAKELQNTKFDEKRKELKSA